MIESIDINAQVKESIWDLHRGYHSLNWFQKLFYPGNLAQALEQYSASPDSENAIDVLEAVLNQTWFFQKWFFQPLSDFFKSTVFSCIELVQNNKLLEGEEGRTNYETLMKGEEISEVYETLKLMDQKGLLYNNGENFDQVFQRQDPLKDTHSALIHLNECNRLDGDEAEIYFDTVTMNKHPLDTALSLTVLHTAGLLEGENAQENRAAISGLQFPTQARKALVFLEESTDLLRDPEQAQINFNKLIENKWNYWTVSLLAEMQVPITQEQLDIIVNPKVAGSLYIAVSLLQKLLPSDARANRFVEGLFNCSELLFGREEAASLWYKGAKLWLKDSVLMGIQLGQFRQLIQLAEAYQSDPSYEKEQLVLNYLKRLIPPEPEKDQDEANSPDMESSTVEEVEKPEPSPAPVSQSPSGLFTQKASTQPTQDLEEPMEKAPSPRD